MRSRRLSTYGRCILFSCNDNCEYRILPEALVVPGIMIEYIREDQRATASVAQHSASNGVLLTYARPSLGGIARVRRLRRAKFDGRLVVTRAAASAITTTDRALRVATVVIEPAVPSFPRAAAAAA